MANPIFFYEACESSEFTASAGTYALSDINNLSNRNPNSAWKSGALTDNQTLIIALPAARAVTTIAIGPHNLLTAAVDASISIDCSDNGTSWTNVGSTNDMTPQLLVMFASVTKRYWRLTLSGSGAFTVAPEIANIFIGTPFVPAYPYDAAIARGEKFSTVISRSLNGTPYAVQKLIDGIEGWKSMKWSNASDAIANGFIALNSSVRGSGRPFYFYDLDGTCRLVMIVGDTITVTQKKYNANDIALELQAFLANTITTI